MNKATVKRPGLMTTIQDGGRFGYRHLGVTTAGAMDQDAFKSANFLLGNSANDAVLEATMMGPSIQFHHATHIAITGANLSPKLNGLPLENGTVVEIRGGDLLSFGRRVSGCRAYIAVAGGWQGEEVMQSRSTHLISQMGGMDGRLLIKGDELRYRASDGQQFDSEISLRKQINIKGPIPLFRGPEFDEDLIEYMTNTRFKVGVQSNRMAYVLTGDAYLLPSDTAILSGPVMPGIIQLPPSGRPIVLMRDCQTTGGYPRIFCIDEEGINRLAQYAIGNELSFSFVR